MSLYPLNDGNPGISYSSSRFSLGSGSGCFIWISGCLPSSSVSAGGKSPQVRVDAAHLLAGVKGVCGVSGYVPGGSVGVFGGSV